MFAHRGNAMLSNHNQRGPSLIHHNDENASITTNMKQLSNNSNATTPASKPGTSKRRAFGDISNKKSSASANGGSKSSNANNLVIKKSNVFTPARSLKLQTLQSSNQQQIKPLGTKITASSSVVPKSSSKQVILPRKNATKTVLFEPVDDVELPAGRLFSQEPQDDDGDLTQLSEDEFHRTMWDDWRSSMDQKYKEAEAANDAHTDLQVQERMNSVFQNDQDDDNGIDTLLDWVDDLDLDSPPDFEKEEDDEWSQPASSVLGCLDETVLFEL